MSESKTIFRDHHRVDAFIDLAFIDRIRLLFGSRLRFRAEIGLPWRTEIEVHTSAIVDKVFAGKEKIEAEQLEPA